MYKNFPYSSYPDTCIASLIINISYRCGTLVTNDEPTLTHHNYSTFTVYIMAHSQCCSVSGLRQMYNDMYHLLFWYHTQVLHCIKNHLCSTCSSIYLHPNGRPPETDLFTVSIVLSFPECHIVGNTQCAILFRLA